MTARSTKRPRSGSGRPPSATPSTRAEPILVALDLVKDYRTDGSVTRALGGVSLEVQPGRFLSVMGPSGSGKSTLLHLLGGLDTPTSGQVVLGGRRLSDLDDREVTLARRGTVGFVFQFFNLVPVLSVEENIALPLVIAGLPPSAYQSRVDEVIALVGLEDCRQKLPSEISGGQQQRVAIARAIVPEPAIVLADEPTGNLDTRTSREVLALLKRLQVERGQTILIVTHDPRAAAWGDEVIYLEDGRIRSRLDLSKRSTRRDRRSYEEGGEVRASAVLAWLSELGA